jgi:hypothetical protein
MKVISPALLICFLLSFATYGAISAEIFPPQESGYLGDHVVITTPGKYTLERPIHHGYPVGMVILSSSVVISGNGHTISPSSSGEESVGIWIAAYDSQGIPITDITLSDLHIEGETCGIFIEGDDFTPFSWANDEKKPTESNRQNLLSQMIDILSSTISSCATAIGISDGIGVHITDVELYENEYGIAATGKDLEIKNSIITKNSKAGIFLDDVIGASLSQNTITENNIGIEAKNSSIEVFNETSTYENKQNIVTDEEDTLSFSDVPLIFSSFQDPHTLDNEEEDSSGEPKPLQETTLTPLPIQTFPAAQNITIPKRPLTTSSPVPSLIPSLTPLQTPSPSSPPVTKRQTTGHSKNPISRNFISGTHATIISDTIPHVLSPGSKNQVSITIANTGTLAWNSDEGIGISAVGDTARYAPEWLPITTGVRKSDEYTFYFTLLAPGTSGEYTFLFQAEKKRSEMTATFGRPYMKTVLIS